MSRLPCCVLVALSLNGLASQSQRAQIMSTNIQMTTRAELTEPQSWESAMIDVVFPGTAGTPMRVERRETRTTLLGYSLPPGSIHLAVIADKPSGVTYINRAEWWFYLFYNNDLLACHINGGRFSWSESLFKASGDTESTIASFVAAVDDETIANRHLNYHNVDLRHAVPLPFFTAGSRGGSFFGKPTVTDIDITDGVLRLDLLSDGDKYRASFWIDLAAQKLLRATIDGKETDLRVW